MHLEKRKIKAIRLSIYEYLSLIQGGPRPRLQRSLLTLHCPEKLSLFFLGEKYLKFEALYYLLLPNLVNS